MKNKKCECGNEEFFTMEDKSAWWNEIRNKETIILHQRCLKCNQNYFVRMNKEEYQNEKN